MNLRNGYLAMVALCLCPSAQAGSYIFAGEANGVDLVTHPPGYTGAGGNITVNVCIVPASPNASNMEVPVQNVIDQFNRLVTTTSNLRTGADNEVANTEVDYESILLHELGHCIGLAHPNLATESGLTGADQNYTKTTDGADNTFNLGIGTDAIRGSADDSRGDDINLHWFNSGINNPFFETATVDNTTYTRNVGSLPVGETMPANADRTVSTLYSVSNTEAAMQQGSFTDEDQRSLAADDVNALRYARSGLDSLAGTADDYTVTLNYQGVTSSGCDVNVSFDDAETGFAVCKTSGTFLSADNVAITAANVYTHSGFNWFFSTARVPDPAVDALSVPQGGTATSLTGGATSVLANDTHPLGASLAASTTLFGGPLNGSASINSDGTFSYTHDGSSTTSDYFVYRACTSGNGNACAHQVVNVTVTSASACPTSLSLAANTWTLLGLGCDMGTGNTVQDVLGDDLLPADYLTRWIVWEHDPVSNAYNQLALGDTLTPNQGYWIISLDATTVDVAGSANGARDIALTGVVGGQMNLLGNFYPNDICWEDAQVIDGASTLSLASSDPTGDCHTASPDNSCILSATAWRYNGASYEAFNGAVPGVNNTLATGEGFWVRAFKPGIDLRLNDTSACSGTRARLAPGEWYQRLAVSADGMTDGFSGNVLGQLQASVDGFDPRDLNGLPPPFAPFLSLDFPHPEWGAHLGDYNTDFRAVDREAKAWAFEVRSDRPRTITLSWDDPYHQLYRVTLVDVETGTEIQPMANGEYRVTMVDTTHRFVWRVAAPSGEPSDPGLHRGGFESAE